jgi:hypothetical protein
MLVGTGIGWCISRTTNAEAARAATRESRSDVAVVPLKAEECLSKACFLRSGSADDSPLDILDAGRETVEDDGEVLTGDRSATQSKTGGEGKRKVRAGLK